MSKSIILHIVPKVSREYYINNKLLGKIQYGHDIYGFYVKVNYITYNHYNEMIIKNTSGCAIIPLSWVKECTEIKIDS